ncbi:hypothetical protein [Clostridium sp. B9]|uniref:hypothetical protein n=1 Tax=Clostridium sp. B9 TaxID=3423224 RepID=UPI003D2EFEF2
MNKRFFTFVILFLTTVTVGIMFWSTSARFNLSKEINDGKLKNEFVEQELDTDRIIKEIEKNIISENVRDIDNETENNDLEKDSSNRKDIIDKEESGDEINNKSKVNKDREYIINDVEGDYSNKGNYSLEEEEESLEVFKVDKFSIPSRIKRSDKLKLLSIAKNLSIVDYGVLLEHVKRSDELGAAVDIFKILKNKLDDDDYNLIKEVMNPYINIELIENNI